MADKIKPERIAEKHGMDVEDVNRVLSELIPNYLFERYVDNDMTDVEYVNLTLEYVNLTPPETEGN